MPRRRLIVNIAIAIDLPDGFSVQSLVDEALDFVKGAPPGNAHRCWTSGVASLSAYRTSKWEQPLPPLERERPGAMIARAEHEALTSMECRQ